MRDSYMEEESVCTDSEVVEDVERTSKKRKNISVAACMPKRRVFK